jgi:hypothetical protein
MQPNVYHPIPGNPDVRNATTYSSAANDFSTRRTDLQGQGTHNDACDHIPYENAMHSDSPYHAGMHNDVPTACNRGGGYEVEYHYEGRYDPNYGLSANIPAAYDLGGECRYEGVHRSEGGYGGEDEGAYDPNYNPGPNIPAAYDPGSDYQGEGERGKGDEGEGAYNPNYSIGPSVPAAYNIGGEYQGEGEGVGGVQVDYHYKALYGHNSYPDHAHHLGTSHPGANIPATRHLSNMYSPEGEYGHHNGTYSQEDIFNGGVYNSLHDHAWPSTIQYTDVEAEVEDAQWPEAWLEPKDPAGEAEDEYTNEMDTHYWMDVDLPDVAPLPELLYNPYGDGAEPAYIRIETADGTEYRYASAGAIVEECQNQSRWHKLRDENLEKYGGCIYGRWQTKEEWDDAYWMATSKVSQAGLQMLLETERVSQT